MAQPMANTAHRSLAGNIPDFSRSVPVSGKHADAAKTGIVRSDETPTWPDMAQAGLADRSEGPDQQK